MLGGLAVICAWGDHHTRTSAPRHAPRFGDKLAQPSHAEHSHADVKQVEPLVTEAFTALVRLGADQRAAFLAGGSRGS